MEPIWILLCVAGGAGLALFLVFGGRGEVLVSRTRPNRPPPRNPPPPLPGEILSGGRHYAARPNPPAPPNPPTLLPERYRCQCRTCRSAHEEARREG